MKEIRTCFRGLSVDGAAAEVHRGTAQTEVLNLSFNVRQTRNGLLHKKRASKTRIKNVHKKRS